MKTRTVYHRQRKTYNVALSLYALLGGYLIICVLLFPLGQESILMTNYVVDAFAGLIVLGLCLYYSLRSGFDIFDPIYLVTTIYGFLYFFTPMYDIVTGHHTWFGYNLFPYGVKATWIALGGYISFFFFYTTRARIIYEKKIRFVRYEKNRGFIELKRRKEDIRILFILAMYAVCFAANLIYLLHSGYTSLLYIMTLGLFGSGDNIEENLSSIGYLAMFSYCLPTIVLLYWKYSKDIWKTVMLFVPMLIMQITRGFRFFIVQIAITFAAYIYISKGKRPKLSSCIGMLFLLMIPVLIMTMFRNDIRAGHGLDIGLISFSALNKALEDAVWDNFRIYNNFYGLVNKVPSQYGYVYGRQIVLGTLIMMIPRFLWPSKISSAAGVDLDQMIGRNMYGTGQALPGLGEFYYACGTFGVLFFMAIYAVFLRYVWRRLIMNTRGELDIVVFSVLLGANLQILIRGYTPSNFWYVVFSIAPVYAVKLLNSYLYDSQQADERREASELAAWERQLKTIRENKG